MLHIKRGLKYLKSGAKDALNKEIEKNELIRHKIDTFEERYKKDHFSHELSAHNVRLDMEKDLNDVYTDFGFASEEVVSSTEGEFQNNVSLDKDLGNVYTDFDFASEEIVTSYEEFSQNSNQDLVKDFNSVHDTFVKENKVNLDENLSNVHTDFDIASEEIVTSYEDFSQNSNQDLVKEFNSVHDTFEKVDKVSLDENISNVYTDYDFASEEIVSSYENFSQNSNQDLVEDFNNVYGIFEEENMYKDLDNVFPTFDFSSEEFSGSVEVFSLDQKDIGASYKKMSKSRKERSRTKPMLKSIVKKEKKRRKVFHKQTHKNSHKDNERRRRNEEAACFDLLKRVLGKPNISNHEVLREAGLYMKYLMDRIGKTSERLTEVDKELKHVNEQLRER